MLTQLFGNSLYVANGFKICCLFSWSKVVNEMQVEYLCLVPKYFVPVQFFWASPKIWLHLVPLQKLLCLHKNQFYWMQIIFLSVTKCLWLAQYVNKFLVQHKKIGPAQNILGLVKGQGKKSMYEKWGHIDLNGFDVKKIVKSNGIKKNHILWAPIFHETFAIWFISRRSSDSHQSFKVLRF